MLARKVLFAIIGGSGFYEIDGLDDVTTVEVETPFGRPSSAIVVGLLRGVRTAFIARHGPGHRFLPNEVPQKANIWALASLGVRSVVSVSAVGSLKEEIAPLHMVVPDQLIDRTTSRPHSFFGRGVSGHIAFDTPYCPTLSETLFKAAHANGNRVHEGGTLVVIEGPGFSTRAESLLYKSWGASIIGMTALPEARLAREAGICYATLACVTDYDTWHPGAEKVSINLVLENLAKNIAAARNIVADVAAHLPDWRQCAVCPQAVATAIVSSVDAAPEETKRDLAPLLERYEAARAGFGERPV
jgi:5'-methylthioadenosine phosphorylase